ncbi:hypothetical protein [Streptomyces diastatochromogenes]|uniref:hypothetical protein n=1 Tax=Streptomyces diastatochromogenes TaxID=42236 RepID=UPI0036BA7C8D
MIAVTTEQLEQAEGEARRAQEALQEAEREYATNRASSAAYGKHQDAITAADQAKVRARLLREDWERQQVVRDARAAEGEAAARELAREVEGLAASREAAVEAVVDAVRALRFALGRLGEHDQQVRAVSAALDARGLVHRDGEATGAGRDGSVWISEKLWPLIDGGGVLAHALAEVVSERWPRHPLTRVYAAPYGGVTAAKGRDEVLDAVRAARGR